MDKKAERSEISASKTKNRGLKILLPVFFALLVLLTAFASVYGKKLERERKKAREEEALNTTSATETPPTPEPTEEPTPEPTEEPTPMPTAQFIRTAIVSEGRTLVVLASRQAAEELLERTQEYFEELGELPDTAVTELVTKIVLEPADENAEATSYDTAFELFTGPDTPLVFRSVNAYFEDIVIPHRDRLLDDSSLPQGDRVVKVMGRDGVERRTYSEYWINGVKSSEQVVESLIVMEPVDGEIMVGSRVFKPGSVVSDSFGSTPYEAMILRFTAPVRGEITRLFGPYDGGFHHGIDIAAAKGTEVVAACDGTVVSVMERGAYGLMVEVEHMNSVCTRYAKLDSVTVSVGDAVKAGDVLGFVGGADSEPHLHFELRIRGTAYNPLKILSRNDIKG